MKKLVTLFLVLFLLPVAALGELSAPGVYPISDEKLELDIWCTQLDGTYDYDTNTMVTTYEELSNVHVNWEVAIEDRATQYSLSIASGEEYWPDIYLYNINSNAGSELLTLAADGVIIPLNDLIDNETVYIKAYLDAHPEIREAITAPDGNIYSLFSSLYTPTEDQMIRLWVYEEWLEAYKAATGKGMPSTPNELRDMLIYFRDNDMNGNGEADEIPLTGTYAYWHDGSDPMHFILNAFEEVNVSEQPFTHVEDGKFVFEANTDDYREGLKFVRSLVEEKLLVEQTYVQDLNQFRALTSVPIDKVTVGCAVAPYPGRLLTRKADDATYTDYSSYVLIPPLTGENGHVGIPYRYESLLFFRGMITTACEDPVLAIKWLDWWYSEEGQTWTAVGGPEGIGYYWADEPAIDGSERSIVIPEKEANHYLPWSYGVPFIIEADQYTKSALSQAYTSASATMTLIKQPYTDAAIPHNIPQVVWNEDLDLGIEKAELDTLIKEYTIGSATEFVLGVRDINDDAQWQSYLDELNNMGLEHYIDVLNQYYGLEQ